MALIILSMSGDKNTSVLLCLTVFAVALTTSAQDGVYSFNMGNGPNMSGDVAAANNPNGLQITGQVGDWPNLWTTLTAGKSSATDDGVTLEFDLNGAGCVWGGTTGDNSINLRYDAIRIGTPIGSSANIPWTVTGLTANAYYDMIWYNKRGSPTTPGGESRHPWSGVDGFDAGNGVGQPAPVDADQDQNFQRVQADGSGAISGTWFYTGGAQTLTAVAGVQITESPRPPAAGGTLFVFE